MQYVGFFILILNFVFGWSARAQYVADESQYENVRQQLVKAYSDQIRSRNNVGFKIELYGDDSESEAASVSLEKDFLVIGVGSQFQKINNLSVDGYMATLCHEVGHLLGGEPRKKRQFATPEWNSTEGASIEGQSDYFSASVCMKKMFALDMQTTAMKYSQLSLEIKNMCDVQFVQLQDKQICGRTIQAGYDFAIFIYNIFNKYNGSADDYYTKKPNISSVEKTGISDTKEYPSLQCRLDTFIAGALSKERPSCWFPYKYN